MSLNNSAALHAQRRCVRWTLMNVSPGAQAKGYVIDYDDWHAHVHGVLPYDRCLARDERLRAIIKARPGS